MTYEPVSLPRVVRMLDLHLGPSLVALMAGGDHEEAVHWSRGGQPNDDQEARLRTGYEVFTELTEAANPSVAFGLMLGTSPHLDGGSLVHAVSRGRLKEAAAAARETATELRRERA